MKQKIRKLTCLIVTLAIIFSCSFSGILIPAATAQAATLFAIAPFNSDFSNYIAAQGSTNHSLAASAAAGANYTGHIPSPFKIAKVSQTAIRKVLGAFEDPLPASYNTSKTDYQTTVKDQAVSGPCWAFASLSALESFLLTKSESVSDFSERNLMNTHGYDLSFSNGGNRDMAMAYLARWDGPVYETDDLAFSPPSSATIGHMPQNARKHVQDTIYIAERDFTTIKKAIREYGSIYSDMYYNNVYYNATNSSYNCNVSDLTNHAITIVGWDDNYPKENFNVQPSQNGAFIVKNSWGTSWGANGYFYVSYEDVNFGQENYTFTEVDNVGNYDNIYQYDPLGSVSSCASDSVTIGWFANVFTASAAGSEALKAVAFYTTAPAASYEVFVAPATESGTPPDFSAATPVVSGIQTYAGYHTIDLPEPIELIPSAKFVVAVKVVNPEPANPAEVYPVACEFKWEYYTSQASAAAGQSYLGYAGGAGWDDTTQIQAFSGLSLNLCLKAFTDESNKTYVTFDPQGGTVSPAAAAITLGQPYGTLPTPVRTGYTFSGWFTEPNGAGSKITSTSTVAVTENQVLYALWTVKKFMVSFNSNGGSSIPAQTVEYNGKATQPADPTRSGYAFVGWYTSTSYATPWSFTTAITASRTLYARWLKSPVTGLMAASSGFNSIMLAWSAVSGASGYQIYRALPGGQYNYVTSTTTDCYNNTGLVAGTRYYYKVRAYTLFGTTKKYSSFSAAASAVPSTISGFTAKSASYSSINLAWAPVSGVSGYQVYRAASSTSTYALVKTTTGTSFTNTGLTAGKTYYYKVRAYRIVGSAKVYGSYTAPAAGKPVPAVPANFAALRASSTSIKSSWNAVSGASGYQVYRAASSTGTYALVKTTTGTSLTNTGLTAGKTYYYRVRAYRTVGTTKIYGAFSAVKSAKT